MKKINNGKLYDTETATAVGSWSYGYGRDLDRVTETLYVKKNGEYFVHGTGGPNSQYCQHTACNEWCGGEDILCVSIDKAKEWVEQHLDADTYISLFGSVSE